MLLAVIPARRGSKRIPGKNIRDFCGRPMIAWSIRTALESACFDRVVVSTDDSETAEIARAWGAEVPFLRPAQLADDYTGTTPVVAHATAWHQAQGLDVEAVCCVYATAPLLSAADLRTGLQKLRAAKCDYALSVTHYPFPIQRAIRISNSGRVEMIQEQYMNTRSQDLEEAFHDAAQFYWGQRDAWLQLRPVFSPASVPVVVPRHRVQDIDTPEDWRVAEAMFLAARPS